MPLGDENSLQTALANIGSVSVAVHVTSNFQYYISGIFKDPICKKTYNDLNHAIILFGYETDANV